MLRLAFASALVMAQLATAQSDSSSGGGDTKFANCLCYNQKTQTFCHGNDWYNSQACQDWFFANYSWTFAFLTLIFIMAAFPFVFCCSRFCCQCCGGRHATRGCCCSDASTRSIFPGYTNRSIAASRGAYMLAFALAITMTLVTLSHSNNFHSSANQSFDVIQYGVQNLQQYGAAVNSIADYTAQTTPTYFTNVLPAVTRFDLSKIETVTNSVQIARDAENNDGYGRKHITMVLSFWALVVPVVAFIPMACSWKSSMNVFLIIQTLIATVILIGVVPTAAFSEVLTETCDQWQPTTANFVTGLFAHAGIGNTQQQGTTITSAINTVLSSAQSTSSQASASSATGDGSGSSTALPNFCADVAAICNTINGCPTTPCAGSVSNYGCNGATPTTFQGWGFNQQMQQFLNTPCMGQSTTIASLASQDAKAQAIVNFANSISGFQQVDGYYNTIGWVNNIIQNVYYPLCSDLQSRAKNVAVSLGVQFLVSIFLGVAIFLGIKRFAKWNSYNPYAEYLGISQEAAPVITAIVVEINHDAPWSPSPNGYAQSPVGGYAEVEAC